MRIQDQATGRRDRIALMTQPSMSLIGPFRDRLGPGRMRGGREADMRRDSFERFYYEKVALEGCGCAEYVSSRLRDLDGLAVKAEARGLAWSSPERQPGWRTG